MTIDVKEPGHYRIATKFGDEIVALTEDFTIEVVPDEKPNVEILRPGTYEALVKHLEATQDQEGSGFYHVIHFDAHGALLAYEELAEGMEKICGRFGIPWEGSLGVRAKGDYRKDRTHYSQVLTEAQREILGRVFAREIEMHGYEWQDGPGA